MIPEVLDVALRKRPFLLAKIDRFRRTADCGKSWESFCEVESADYEFVGVDGSRNMVLYKDFAIYALAAESVRARGGFVEVYERTADIDVLLPYWLHEERVRLYMTIMELRLALRALKELSDAFVILDGSIASMLVRPWRYAVSSQLRRSVLEDFHYQVLSSVEGGDPRVVSKEIVEGIIEEGGEEVKDKALLLEYIEYLTLLYKLLSEYPERLAAIAKQSEAHRLSLRLPDVAFYEHATKGPGYVEDSIVTLRDHKGGLPAYWDFFRNLTLRVVYVRLENGGPVLKLELPSNTDLPPLLKALSRYSVKGYPYFMAKAHSDVVISTKDMEGLMRVLGLYGMRTGREVLAR